MAGRAARGAAWIVAARFVMRAFGFVNTIILARLLVPEDFGLVAVAMTAMQLLQGFSDIGISQAVVRFHDADRDDLDTLFTLGALRGSAIALLLCALAPLAAQFYGDPRMFWVFVGIAFQPFLMGLLNPRFFEFERNLDFSKEFVSNAVNKFAGVAVSIVVAVVFRTYWAIILGVVTSAAMPVVVDLFKVPKRIQYAKSMFELVHGGLTLADASRRLGLPETTGNKAYRTGKAMAEQGLDDAYTRVTDMPDRPGRWRPHTDKPDAFEAA